MADVNQVGQSALSKAPGPIRRLLSGINPQFSGYSGLSQGIGPQPAQGGPIAGVEPGSPNKILVTDPTRFLQSPRQTAVHESIHSIQNNLSPAQQRAIPADTGNPLVALDPHYLAQQRANGVDSILKLPKEQQAYLAQYYTAQQEAFEKGAITPQQMQHVEQTYGPWIQDFNKAQLSNIEPTDPSSSTLNTTPRAPMQPVSLQQDAVQFAPQQGPVTQSLLAGMNQPQQPAPQYVPPVVANTNKWAGIVQGALAGLGGGLRAGMQNVQDAGTPQGPHANGYAEGADASQKLQDAQKLQQDQATKQAQQDFENQNKTAQMTQEQQLNKARLAEANLNHLKLAMEMDKAPQDAQDSYYKEQDGHANDLRKQGMSELAEVPDLNSAAQWMQQNKKGSTDTTYTHHKGEDGKDRIQIWENPDHDVDASTINRGLTAHNYPSVPAGTTMNYGDYKSLLGKAHGAQAEELMKSREQKQKDAAEMARTQATQAGEDRRAKDKQSGGQSPDDIAHLGEAIAKGNLTEDQVPGFAKIKPSVQAYLAQNHPDLDQNSVMLTGEERKRRDLAGNALHNLDTIQQTIKKRPDLVGMISGRISHGLTLAGTDDPDLATINTALDNYALAGTGAHGIRAVQARVDAREALLNGLKNGPEALNASIETSRSSLKNLASAGSPRKQDGTPYNKPADKIEPIVQRSKSTGKTRVSLDGGKTWKMD